MSSQTSSETDGAKPSISPDRPNLSRTAPDNLPRRAEDAAQDTCPFCKGVGFVISNAPLGHPDFGKAIPCQCKRMEHQMRKVSRLQKLSDLQTLSRFTFDSFDPEPAWQAPAQRQSVRRAFEIARAYSEDPQGWLFIQGSYGCGKTHLAAAIANARLERGQPVIFVVTPDLLDHLRMTFAPQSGITYDELFHEIREAELLVLDDFGAHSSTPWAQEKLFQLLNHRYNGQLPTVLTTNLRLDQIEHRLRSRLQDIQAVTRVLITAPDFRGGASPGVADLSTLSLHAEQTFETFEIRRRNISPEAQANLRRVREAAEEYAHEPKGWFVLMGANGVGKTHLAAAIANVQSARGIQDAMFVVTPDLLDYLRAAFNPATVIPYDRRFDDIKRSPLLVLDDLGTESATPWAREKLFQLLNFRYDAMLPTVITTSATIKELEPWLATRMADAARCQVWVIKAPSYRGSFDQIEAESNKEKSSGRTRRKRSW